MPKIQVRIPTEQYGYIELEFDSLEEAKASKVDPYALYDQIRKGMVK